MMQLHSLLALSSLVLTVAGLYFLKRHFRGLMFGRV